MAELILKNTGVFNTTYNDEEIEILTNEVSVTILSGVTATKSANKTVWVNGLLTYTIVLTNNTGAPLIGGVFTDQLDGSAIQLYDATGVVVNGEPAVYYYSANLLSVILPTPIEDGGTVEIVFNVEQI